jgi:hypothetical protein
MKRRRKIAVRANLLTRRLAGYGLKRAQALFRRAYYPSIALLFVLLFLMAANLIASGQHWFGVSIAVTMAIGFLLTFHPKYGYYGSLTMTCATVFFVSLHLSQTFFSQVAYALPIVVGGAIGLPLLLHYLTRTRIVLPNYITFFFVIAYVLTTLLAFYMEGASAGSNLWVILTSYSSIVFLLLVPLNFGFKQLEVSKIINIADLEVYSKIVEGLKASVRRQREQELEEADGEVEKIVSEFRVAVESFLYGYNEGSIIHSSNVKEGLDRIFYHWMKIDTKQKFLENEKEALDEWRQKIAHSNVKKPIDSLSKQKEKEKKEKKKLENRYIQEFKTAYHIALESIDFAMQVTLYVTNYENAG